MRGALLVLLMVAACSETAAETNADINGHNLLVQLGELPGVTMVSEQTDKFTTPATAASRCR